jgi:molybdopterin-guanine dinucleotide biosynthesis protein A
VIAVGGDASQLGPLGLDVVPDAVAGIGPIGGLVAALRHSVHHDAVVVVSCDVPRLESAVVRALVGALEPGVDVAVAVTDRRQPLCAVWRPACVSTVDHAVAQGERRIWKVLEQLVVREVPVEPRALANMNTPSDLNE